MNNAPTREPAIDPANKAWPRAWVLWFTQVYLALSGWNKTMKASLTHDFGSISGASQLSTTVTVAGARTGDSILITPNADTAGIIYSGVVTASNTVTIYAKNITAGAINPVSTTFRIIVFQN